MSDVNAGDLSEKPVVELPKEPLPPIHSADDTTSIGKEKHEGSHAQLDETEAGADVHHTKTQQPGVSKIEAFTRAFGRHSWAMYVLYGAVAGVMVATCLDGSTVYTYEAIAASSYGEHGTLLATIATVNSIMSAVSKPFIAKVCDMSSRQASFIVMLCFYVVGYAVVAGSRTAEGFAAGRVISVLGNSGLEFTAGIIVSDLSPLQWRGLIQGLSAVPWIPFSFVGPNISGPLIDRGLWRWGYGMFCIISPALILPAVAILYAADRRARASGELSIAESPFSRRYKEEHGGARPTESILSVAQRLLIEIDAIGLFLLGASFILLLAPFSLASQQPRGWNEPFIIAMMTLGAILVLVFWLWELRFASQPLMTKRIFFNRTFQLAMGIDFCYFIGGYLQLVYYSSYVYLVKDWTATEWGYFNNELTVALCGGGLIVGGIMRLIHRYKIVQLSGLMLRCIGAGIIYYARGENASTGALVMGTALAGLGGSCSVIGTQVATQASVPHQDLASVIALLSLFTTIGGSIGSAIAGAVWTNTMPANLLKEGIPAEMVPSIYGGLLGVHDMYPLGDPIRQAVVRAAGKTLEPLFIASLVITFFGVIFGSMMPNYRLGKSHNAIDGKDVSGRLLAVPDRAVLPPKAENETLWQWVKREFI